MPVSMPVSMVERIARILCKTGGQVEPECGSNAPLRAADLAHARTVLHALRGPTEAMLETVRPAPSHWNLEGPDGPSMRTALMAERVNLWSDWNDMIDAALAE